MRSKRAKQCWAIAVVMMILASALTVAAKTIPTSPLDTLPKVAAHRGAADVNPENTLAAFRAVTAAHPGIILEMDVRALGDGSLVVFHDSTLDRTTSQAGKLSDLTALDWYTVRVNHPQGGPSVPATFLAEVLQEYGGTDVPMFIELKTPTAANQFIQAVWPYRDQIVAASFNETIVSRFARSDLHTMQLSSTAVQPIEGVEYMGIKNQAITANYVANTPAKIWAWGSDVTMTTVNTDTRGVDGFITDDPTGWKRVNP